MLAVITGASSGIGAAFARKLAERGYDLLLVARREDRLASLAAEVQSRYRVQVETMAGDLIQEPDCERLAQRLLSAPDLGLLVNNAGFGSDGYFFETDLKGQIDMHKLHVLATVRLCHAAVQNLIRSNSPAPRRGIINVASVAGFNAAPQNVSYGATKRWMNHFTETMALEFAATGKNITVQALCPGYTQTEFQDKLRVDKSQIPKWLWMPADFVVEESLVGFGRGRLFVIPGWHYKTLVFLIKVLPSFMIRWGTVRLVRRYRSRKAAASSAA